MVALNEKTFDELVKEMIPVIKDHSLMYSTDENTAKIFTTVKEMLTVGMDRGLAHRKFLGASKDQAMAAMAFAFLWKTSFVYLQQLDEFGRDEEFTIDVAQRLITLVHETALKFVKEEYQIKKGKDDAPEGQ